MEIPEIINSFSGEFAFLSNFWPASVEWAGIEFPTSEHAFQAAKTTSQEAAREIAALPTPGQAKRAGRKVAMRPDWDLVRISVMQSILFAKFRQNPDLAEKLLATGFAKLVEGNVWHDNFWGICKCANCGSSGQNHLGESLQLVRARLTEERAKTAS